MQSKEWQAFALEQEKVYPGFIIRCAVADATERASLGCVWFTRYDAQSIAGMKL